MEHHLKSHTQQLAPSMLYTSAVHYHFATTYGVRDLPETRKPPGIFRKTCAHAEDTRNTMQNPSERRNLSLSR
ncbi:hypothetical protein HanRHA438_Chr12g0543641 [Helianthus annuus]|nr:hypothetical protein HanRHA438_Chr12g0543641 [Helianthus annuus]